MYQTDWIDRERERQRDRETERQRDRETERQREREIRLTKRHVDLPKWTGDFRMRKWINKRHKQGLNRKNGWVFQKNAVCRSQAHSGKHGNFVFVWHRCGWWQFPHRSTRCSSTIAALNETLTGSIELGIYVSYKFIMSSYTPSQQAMSKKSRENHQVRVELAGFQWSKQICGGLSRPSYFLLLK